MRALIQRVTAASVTVEEKIVGEISQGLLVFFGMQKGDHSGQLPWLVEKLIHLRIFSDEAGKMNRSVLDVGGSLLVVSQFTLYGDCRSGRRPSFASTLPPECSKTLYNQLLSSLRKSMSEQNVQAGVFGAEMVVRIENDGPVTFLLETPDTTPP